MGRMQRQIKRYTPPPPPAPVLKTITEEIVYVPVPRDKLAVVYAVLAEGLEYEPVQQG